MSKDYLMAKFYEDYDSDRSTRVKFLELMPENAAAAIAVKNMRDSEVHVEIVRVTSKDGRAPPKTAMLP